MNIQNSSFVLNTNISLNANLTNNNIETPQNNQKNDDALKLEISKINKLTLSLQDSNIKLSSIQNDSNKINEQINTLGNIKELLVQIKQQDTKDVKTLAIKDLNSMIATFNEVFNASKSNDKLFLPKGILISDIKEVNTKPVFDVEDFFKNIPQNVKNLERESASQFLNPNQKFYSKGEQNSFLREMETSNINLLLLSPADQKIFMKNMAKAGFEKLDIKTEFDSVLDSVYSAKRVLEDIKSIRSNSSTLPKFSNGFSNSLSNNSNLKESSSLNSIKSINFADNTNKSEGVKSNEDLIDAQINTLDEIHSKLLQASKEPMSIEKKEKLFDEIKDLLKTLDSDVIEGLFGGFDEFASTPNDYKKGLKEGLSTTKNSEEYLQYRASHVVNVNEYTTLNEGTFVSDLSNQLDEIIEEQKDDIEKLTDANLNVISLSDAEQYKVKLNKTTVDYENLSAQNKTVYLANKYKILEVIEGNEKHKPSPKEIETEEDVVSLDMLKIKPDIVLQFDEYEKLNDEINERFEKVVKTKNDEINNLVNATEFPTTEDAQEYLDMMDRRKLDIKAMSETDKITVDSLNRMAEYVIQENKQYGNKDVSEDFIENLIKNVDNIKSVLIESQVNLTELQGNLKKSNSDNFTSEEKKNSSLDINFSKESSDFSKDNIGRNSGSLTLSQGNKIDENQKNYLLS